MPCTLYCIPYYSYMVSCTPWWRCALPYILMTILLFAFGVGTVHAADVDLGFATYVAIKDAKVEDGNVVITTQDGLYLSRYPYDSTITGVISLKPAIVLGVSKPGMYPLNVKGNAVVQVSTINGPITPGDFLTTSTIQGVAMRATKSGTVLGTALGAYNGGKDQIGKIPVLIDIKFNENGITNKDYLQKSNIISLRFILGALIALVTTVLCFVFFGRYTSKGLEAMGRNPLASGTIKRNMILQGSLFLVLVVSGYAIAYILIRYY